MSDDQLSHQSVTTKTTTRATTRTRWVRGKNGKMPLGRKGAFWIAVPALAALTAAGTGLTYNGVERHLTDDAYADLEAAGVDTADLDIDFQYRDGVATGALPAGVTRSDAEAIPADDLLESFTVEAQEAALPAPEPTPEPEPTAVPAPAELGSTEVSAVLEGDRILLSGTVLTEAHRTELVAAAAAAVGDGNVDDELTVSGLDAAVDGADGRISSLAGIVAAFDGATSASASITDTSIEGEIVTPDGAMPDAVAAAVDASGLAGGVDVVVPATAGPVDVMVALDGGQLTLDGTVLTEAHRDELVAAAAQAVGASNVIDNLVVSGLDPAVDGADGRVQALGRFIGSFSGVDAATATLTDDNLDVTVVAPDQIVANLFIGLSTNTTEVSTELDLSIEEPDVDAEITALQAELDGLAAEIAETVVFATGSNDLTAEAQATLDKVVAAMDAFPNPVVEVSGHTDNVGDAGANQALSQARAQAVVDYLVTAGVDTGRLSARGAGDTEPVASNDTDEGRRQNRRVALTAFAQF